MLRESLAVDRSRSLRIVSCDGRELLLLVGGGKDLVIGWLPDAGPRREPPRIPLLLAYAAALLAALLLPGLAHAQSVEIDLGAAGQAGATAGSCSSPG